MTINQTAIRAGRKFQADVARWLRARDYQAINLRLTGKDDEGDIAVVYNDAVLVLECKRTKTLSLPEFWRQATDEALNFAGHHPEHAGKDILPLLVVARRGKGIADAWVIQPLWQFVDNDQP